MKKLFKGTLDEIEKQLNEFDGDVIDVDYSELKNDKYIFLNMRNAGSKFSLSKIRL